MIRKYHGCPPINFGSILPPPSERDYLTNEMFLKAKGVISEFCCSCIANAILLLVVSPEVERNICITSSLPLLYVSMPASYP